MPTERSRIVTATETRVCASHGPYEANQEALDPGDWRNQSTGQTGVLPRFWTNCPACDQAWQAQVDASASGIEAAARRAAARIVAAGIPSRFLEATIWNWQHGMDRQRAVWNWARDYCHGFCDALQAGRCGILLGSHGTGKTHLAIGVLRHVVEKGSTGHYTTVMDMLGRIKNTYHRDADETESQVVGMLTSVDLLVIDEVGRQLDTAYETAQLFRVLDARYRDLRPTILVSNLNKPKLAEFLGDPIIDRMREAGGAVLSFDWASQRNHGKP